MKPLLKAESHCCIYLSKLVHFYAVSTMNVPGRHGSLLDCHTRFARACIDAAMTQAEAIRAKFMAFAAQLKWL